MKKTILYDEHVKLGGKIVDYAGWALPVMYTSIIEEHLAVRNNAGLFDISHMGEFVVKGKNAKTEITDRESNITIQLWQEAVIYKYLQIFIPPSRSSIAVEPMSCSINAFNSKEGLIILKPKEKFSGSYGVMLQ
mgnify:CR=1 FL=1